MNWNYIGFHLTVEVVLMLFVLLGVSIVQTYIVDNIGLLFKDHSVSNTVSSTSDWMSTFAAFNVKESFNVSAFILWMAFMFGSSFILHLPSMWNKRVQLFRPARPLDPEWYPGLKKPFWHPPNIAFPLLWIPVRISRSIGSSLLWESVNRNPFSPPIVLALVSLVLADIWNQVFFVQHDMFGGFIIMSTLSLLEAAYAGLLHLYVPGAEFFIFPGVAMDAFAAVINLSVAILNRKSVKDQTKLQNSIMRSTNNSKVQ
mmetsp:Transcript_242/g.423  ORF Transcript_242/g.423 Transcript_242/m.423 type:complete len:257 (+) Transcript_242:117-887(+)